MNEFRPNREAARSIHVFEREHLERGEPAVGLAFESVWCPKHAAVYRARWPFGVAAGMLKMFEAFTEDERVIEMCGGDTMRLAAVIHEHVPLCCYLGDDVVARVHKASGVTA